MFRNRLTGVFDVEVKVFPVENLTIINRDDEMFPMGIKFYPLSGAPSVAEESGTLTFKIAKSDFHNLEAS
jgi:hypothetical protein